MAIADVEVTAPVPEPAPEGAMGETVAAERARWQVAGASVRGASHARKGLPNQDALGWLRLPVSGPDEQTHAICLAASDGHGSAKCFRSATGARLAVHAALAVVAGLAAGAPNGAPDVADLALLHEAAEEMVLRWRAAVDADILADPLSDAELEGLEGRDGPGARRMVERSPWIAYGATLLVALATDAYVVYFQLGDGDIVAVTEAGEVCRPMAPDARLFADETTSLCARDAARDIRVGLQRTTDRASAPALILVATDGYANSFRTDAGFLQAGPDLLEMVRAEGLDAVAGCLEAWLDEASACGSGDDVTVGLLVRAQTGLHGPAGGMADAPQPPEEA